MDNRDRLYIGLFFTVVTVTVTVGFAMGLLKLDRIQRDMDSFKNAVPVYALRDGGKK